MAPPAPPLAVLDPAAGLALAAGCPLVLSWLLTALLLRWAPRLGLVDYPSARKVHTRPTPRAGGLAIYAAFALTGGLFVGLGWGPSFLPAVFGELLTLGLAIVALGLVDDLQPLPWQVRLLVQAAVAAVAVLHSFAGAGGLAQAAAVLWVVGLVNAFNMLDNMDALSAGVAWIAAGYLAVLEGLAGDAGGPGPLPYVVLMGAVAGFLWWNRPPARIFMGDAGSTFLGFVVGLGTARLGLRPQLAVGEPGPSAGGREGWSWAVPLCVAAVPCYDLLSVVALRLSQGRSPFQADKQHLSHRLVSRGLSPPAAVGVIYLFALASGANALILCSVTAAPPAALAVAQLAVWWAALAVTEFIPGK
jgi:UDP-GlcNAc:undecaprenyl-phosphate GlcNAc-1-phosphate transferase